ncbi:unnamed protein product [Rhizophagus irregularis]|nr:unnamed protein product [Rhizophagus irregularis]
MFPNKFPNKLPFNFKKLNKEEITDFNQQMIVESEWFIDRLEMCIRSVNCKKKTYSHIKQLNEFFDTEDSSVRFWMELANKSVQGTFDQKPVFKGLCYIMLQAAEREEQGKGLRNLKYSTEFLNFLIVLRSISLKALDLFCKNLNGMTIRTIRITSLKGDEETVVLVFRVDSVDEVVILRVEERDANINDRDAGVEEAIFEGVGVEEAIFCGVGVDEVAIFGGVSVEEAIFGGVSVDEVAIFCDADVDDCDAGVEEAIFGGVGVDKVAIFRDADVDDRDAGVEEAIFGGVDVDEVAIFRDADIDDRDAGIEEAIFEGVSVDEVAIFRDADIDDRDAGVKEVIFGGVGVDEVVILGGVSVEEAIFCGAGVDDSAIFGGKTFNNQRLISLKHLYQIRLSIN